MALASWLKKHPKTVAGAAIVGVVGAAGAAARALGVNIPGLSPLLDKVFGAQAAGGQTPGSTTSQGGGTTSSTSTPPPRRSSTSFKFTVDMSKLPPPSPRSSYQKTAAYDAWVVSSLNQIDQAGLTSTARASSSLFQRAVKKFQGEVGPLPGITVDGIVGNQTEAALIQLGASSPPGAA